MVKYCSANLKHENIMKAFRYICLICIIAFGIITTAASGGGGGDDNAASGNSTDTPNTTNTIESLAVELEKTAVTEADKSRAIWLWITDNIAYDVDSFLSGAYIDPSAEQTLKSRKSVCEGYANLFYALAEAMDLEAAVITGYAKGYGYVEGQVFDDGINHAWNAVKIDNNWQLLDATWGAGVIGSNNEFGKDYDKSWYLPDPEQFIFSHLPENAEWQLLNGYSIDKTRFEELPYLNPEFFSWGFTPQDVYDEVDGIDYRGIVKQYDLIQDRDEVEIIDAPMGRYLDSSSEYTFVISIPDSLAVGLYNETDDTWYWCHDDTGDLPPYGDAGIPYPGVDSGIKTDAGTYTFTLTPTTGNLNFMDVYADGYSQALLEYIVE